MLILVVWRLGRICSRAKTGTTSKETGKQTKLRKGIYDKR